MPCSSGEMQKRIEPVLEALNQTRVRFLVVGGRGT